MHTTRLQRDAQLVAERRAKRLSQCGPAGCVKSAHALQMSSEVTLRHEPRNDCLLEPGASRVECATGKGEGWDEPVRNDQVP